MPDATWEQKIAQILCESLPEWHHDPGYTRTAAKLAYAQAKPLNEMVRFAQHLQDELYAASAALAKYNAPHSASRAREAADGERWK